MPLVKGRRDRPKLGSFTVSPWRTKRRAEHSTDAAAAASPKRARPDSPPPTPPDGGDGDGEEPAAAVQLPGGGAEGPSPSHPARAAGDEGEAESADLDGDGATGEGDEAEHSTDLRGVACIVWLPNGTFSGHFVDSDSKTCFGLHGRELAQVQECTRDEDKKLLLLVITDYRGSEVSVPVEKGGGDFAKLGPLSSDTQWEEMISELSPQVQTDFCCLQMKSGEEAEAYVSQSLPTLCGQGGVLNKGSMEFRGLPFPPVT